MVPSTIQEVSEVDHLDSESEPHGRRLFSREFGGERFCCLGWMTLEVQSRP